MHPTIEFHLSPPFVNFEGKLYTTFTLPNFQPEDYQIVGLIEESFVYEQIIHNKENIQ
jgi:hypothetical protein